MPVRRRKILAVHKVRSQLRDVAAELAARGHLNARGQPFSAATIALRQGDQLLLRGDLRVGAWGRVFGQQTREQFAQGARPDFDGTFGGFQAGADLLRLESISGHGDPIGRRELLVALGGAATAWPPTARELLVALGGAATAGPPTARAAAGGAGHPPPQNAPSARTRTQPR